MYYRLKEEKKSYQNMILILQIIQRDLFFKNFQTLDNFGKPAQSDSKTAARGLNSNFVLLYFGYGVKYYFTILI